MEQFSFDRQEMLKNFNRILEDYYRTNNIDEKRSLYSQLNALSYLLKDNSLIKNIKQKRLDEQYFYELNRKKRFYKELSDLTSELYYGWTNSVRYLNIRNKRILENINLNKDDYYQELHRFFKKSMPSDLKLFEKTFEEKKILVKKRILLERIEMYYFEALKECYITILHCGKLNKITVKNTIHEFGHVSEFMKTGKSNSNNYLMEEVIAKLYELLYIDYCFPKDNDSRYIELSNIFKKVKMTYLNESINGEDDLNDLIMYEINTLYTYVIAAAIYFLKDEMNLYDKIEYIKANTPYLNAFVILENIGITERDLIYTSKNIKKLMLKRD